MASNLHEFVSPRDFSEFAEQVLPVLTARGLFQPPQPASSLRNRLVARATVWPLRIRQPVIAGVFKATITTNII
jgi:hypothetical protein